MRECIPPNLHDPQRAKGPLDRRSKWFSLVPFFLQKKKGTRAGARNAPSRARHFLIRCQFPDCASTAFRCRCLLLWQKLFVLPCRRLRNNYILCPTGTPTFAALRRQRRDLIIATRPAHPILPSHRVSGSGASGTSDPPNRQQCPPPHQFREISTAKFALARPAPRGP